MSCLACLTFTRELLRVLVDFITVLTPSGRHVFSIRSLKGVGASGCLAFYGGVGWCWSASQAPPRYRFRIATGPEHLSKMLDLLPLLSLVTCVLCSDLQALHDSLSTLAG